MLGASEIGYQTDLVNRVSSEVGSGRLLRNGYAITYRHFSMDCAANEDAARAEHRGIWAGSFEEPYLRRREHPHYGYGYGLVPYPHYHFYAYHR